MPQAADYIQPFAAIPLLEDIRQPIRLGAVGSFT